MVPRTERAALQRFSQLTERDDRRRPAKLDALVAAAEGDRRRAGQPTRVVVFSERVPTLKWLAEVVPAGSASPARRGAGDARRRPDSEQQTSSRSSPWRGSPVRLLFTGDVASEGVNLHQQCHHLIHYDMPWSLIRIEQRNGRIDRYGQRHPPQFRALILTSAHEGAKDDTTVAEKLLDREEEAHRSLGTAEAVTGLYDAKRRRTG